MDIVNSKNIKLCFDKEIYNKVSPLYITSDWFLDGGIRTDSSLSDKYMFYHISKIMADFLKVFFEQNSFNIFIADFLCENSLIFPKWSDLKKQNLFQILNSKIKQNKCYQLTMPKDNDLIDLIIESNFRYLSNIVFYLEQSQTIIQPTCHMELLIYSQQKEIIKKTLSRIIALGYDELILKT